MHGLVVQYEPKWTHQGTVGAESLKWWNILRVWFTWTSVENYWCTMGRRSARKAGACWLLDMRLRLLLALAILNCVGANITTTWSDAALSRPWCILLSSPVTASVTVRCQLVTFCSEINEATEVVVRGIADAVFEAHQPEPALFNAKSFGPA